MRWLFRSETKATDRTETEGEPQAGEAAREWRSDRAEDVPEAGRVDGDDEVGEDSETATGAGKRPAGKRPAGQRPDAGKRPAGKRLDAGKRPGGGRRRFGKVPVALGLATVLLGCAAAWSATEADRLRDASSARNAALTDVAGTSEVKGTVTDAVNAIFSFDYADMARTERDAGRLLTGEAVGQYDAMVAQVRAQAAKQKLVLTTTVTDSAVEMLEGRRARLLLFADQRSTRTAAKDTTYAAAMLAVDAVRQGDTWKITTIDTLTAPR